MNTDTHNMVVIHDFRASGKTTKMIKWLRSNDNHLLVVTDSRNQQFLEKKNPDLKGRIMGLRHYLNVRDSLSHEIILGIDDLDYILSDIFKRPVQKITINKHNLRSL